MSPFSTVAVKGDRAITGYGRRSRWLTNAAWRTRPSWAVIATEDKAFDQAMLLHMAKRSGARITTVSASHAVYMTQPKVVADTIEEAARGASKSLQSPLR